MFLIVKKFGIQNTSFKPLKTQEIFNRLQSEDSPHKSGIKTHIDMALRSQRQVGRLAPQIGD